jgi:hypothetical protein
MADAAALLEQTALRMRLILPSPVPLTESDEDVQPSSVQDPNAQPCGNSDNAEGATISNPPVQAEMAQTAGPEDSTGHRELLHQANIAELAEKYCDNEAEDEADESDSELGNGADRWSS